MLLSRSKKFRADFYVWISTKRRGSVSGELGSQETLHPVGTLKEYGKNRGRRSPLLICRGDPARIHATAGKT
jgi:hypothetical protein